MDNVELKERERILPLSIIARDWNADPRTVIRAADRLGVPIIQLSPRKRAIAEQHYALLLKQREVAA